MGERVFARLRLSNGRAAFAEKIGDVFELLSAAPWEEGRQTGERVSASEAVFIAPITPTKIVCVGRNYKAHAAELGNEVPAEPMLFFKPPSALIGPGAAIELPHQSSRVDHEAELGVVIGKRCRNAALENALDYVFGYTCVNDVSARDLQKKDGQWARAKGFDTFCPAGPLLVSGLAPQELGVRCHVSGAPRQDGHTRDMIFPVADLIVYISSVMTLEPGDLIATGTPHGVGPLTPGDTVDVEIDRIGVLSNPVRKAGTGR